ncbi:hypothetical protein [Acidovorax temperans]
MVDIVWVLSVPVKLHKSRQSRRRPSLAYGHMGWRLATYTAPVQLRPPGI